MATSELISKTKDLSIKDDSYKIMTINVEKGSKSKVKATDRRKYFVDIIADNEPDIIFTQEQIKRDIIKIKAAFKDKGIEYVESFIQNETALLAKKSLFDIKRQQIADSESPFKYASEEIKAQIRNRATVTEVYLKNSTVVFAAASWHGPHKSKNKTDVFRLLLDLMLKKYRGKPWVIGGDYNFEREKAEKILQMETYKGCHVCNLSEGKDGKSHIDYFVYHSLQMEDVVILEYPEGGNEALDHLPVVAVIKFKS